MILIIAEKPSVGGEIAKVVGADQKKQGYLLGKNYIVSWCVGHLIELAKPEAYNESLNQWTLDTLPIIPNEYITKVSERTASQFEVLKELMNRADVSELIEATDAGREGELIFRLVYNQAGCHKPFRRLWISSMEEKSIREGLENAKQGKEYDNLYYAAISRQRADWLVGINLTRLYTVMYHKTLTCGRVQTPTISLIVGRQREIKNFTPQIYYRLTADLGNLKAYKRVEEKGEVERIINQCSGKKAVCSHLEKTEKTENPPSLYDLTTLQRESNRIFGYSAQETLDYMQKLYDKKLATYPRTDSRYITADMATSTMEVILKLFLEKVYSTKILKMYDIQELSIERIINDKKVTDHHAIILTESVTQDKISSLPTGEKNILTLIAYRLISAVYVPHVYTSAKALFEIEGEEFAATGREELELGFKFVESEAIAAVKAKEQESESVTITLPVITEGSKFDVLDINSEEKKTQPPKSYTEDTLLEAMETAGKFVSDIELKEAMKDGGLGTPATRASIIEAIIKSGYIIRDGKKLVPTDTAYAFIEVVTPQLKEPELTATWEKQLAEIQKGQLSASEFMDGITDFLRSFVDATKESYSPELCTGVFQREGGIGQCPLCGKTVVEYLKCFSCESGRNGCGFVIWKNISGKDIPKTQAQKILKKGKSDLIKNFMSKKTGKPFDAYLVLKDSKVVFEFNNKEK